MIRQSIVMRKPRPILRLCFRLMLISVIRALQLLEQFKKSVIYYYHLFDDRLEILVAMRAKISWPRLV